MAKKNDISNSTLATLLVVALVVSVGGTYVVLQRAPTITGMYQGGTTQGGTVNFQQYGILSIYLSDPAVTFGNITFNAGTHPTCNIGSDEAANNGGNADCVKSLGADSMLIENDGNINATVKAQINGTSFSNPFLGTSGSQTIKITDKAGETGACAVGAKTSYSTGDFTSSEVTLCTNLQFADATDEINVWFQLHIAADAPSTSFAPAENVQFNAYNAP